MGTPKVSLRLSLPGDRRMRRVLLAYLLCDLIEFATWMAVVLVAYSRGGATAVGVASVAMLLPAILIVPLIAGFGDRMPRGQALSLAHGAVGVTSLVMSLLLVMDAPFWSVVVGGRRADGGPQPRPAMHYSALPFLALRPGDLVAANGLSSFLDGATLFVGFLVAGVVSDLAGPWVVLLVCGVMGVLAALLTTRLGIARSTQAADDSEEPGEIRAAIDGLLALRGRWGPLALLALLGCTFFIDGSNEPLTLTFNAEVLGLGDSTAGLLAGCYGVGLALGGAMQAGLAHRSRLAPVVLAGAGVLGGFWLAVAFVGAIGPAVVMLTLAGMGASLVIVSARTLLQRSTDNLILARVLAIQEGVQMSGQAVGSLVAPLAILVLGPAGVRPDRVDGASSRPGGLRDRPGTGGDVATVRVREVAVLSRVPFLRALPAYELEHLAQTALWRDAPRGRSS